MIAAAQDAAPSDLAELINRQHGAFHLETMLAHFPHSSADLLGPQRVMVLKKRHSTTKQVDLALKQSAFLHETRHFHDAFGTRAGITLFMTRLGLLQDFTRLSLELGAGGYIWPVPITTAKDDSDLPDAGWRFLTFALKALAASSRFRGDLATLTFEPSQVPHPLPHVAWMKEYRLHTKFAAFPAQATRLLPDGGQVDSFEMVPLAFDALLEGNAQVLQRNLIETIWGDEVAKEAFVLLGISVTEPGSLRRFVNYNVSDLMVARFLAHNGHGGKPFSRNSVLTLADRALTEGVFVVDDAPGPDGRTRSLKMSCPGVAFAEDLEKVGPGRILSGTVPTAASDVYAAMRDSFAKAPPWQEQATGSATALADIELLYHWIVHEIIVPLLEARLATSGRLLAEANCYLERFPSLPQVPFIVDTNGVLRTTAPPRIRIAWLHVVVMDRLMTQLLQGARLLRCPRAHAEIPGLDKVNLAHKGDCQDYIEEDLCGRFSPAAGIAGLPRCAFSDALRQLQFAGAPRERRPAPPT